MDNTFGIVTIIFISTVVIVGIGSTIISMIIEPQDFIPVKSESLKFNDDDTEDNYVIMD